MIKQVYQELVAPVYLNKDDYLGPFATPNSSGDVGKAYNLFALIDPISSFTTKYSPTAASFSQSYKLLLGRIETNGAAEGLLEDALEQLGTEVINRGLRFPNFYLIETMPYDLFNVPANTISFTVGTSDSDADFVQIGASETSTVEFNGFIANIIRPWFVADVFVKKKWTIKGCKAGGYSSGDYNNNGLIPLIPMSLVISVDEKGNRYAIGMISDVTKRTPVAETAKRTAPRLGLSADDIKISNAESIESEECSLLADAHGQSVHWLNNVC